MTRDLKIGMSIGLLLTAVIAVWLVTRPNLSTEARVHQNLLRQSQVPEEPNLVEDLPAPVDDIIEDDITEEITEERQYHVVAQGETLSLISYKYYGTVTNWKSILDANHEIIQSPKDLKPGIKLLIPAR